MKLQNIFGKITSLAEIKRKLLIGKIKETRKIKETINSLKSPNHINKIYFIPSEIWLPILCSSYLLNLVYTGRF